MFIRRFAIGYAKESGCHSENFLLNKRQNFADVLHFLWLAIIQFATLHPTSSRGWLGNVITVKDSIFDVPGSIHTYQSDMWPTKYGIRDKTRKCSGTNLLGTIAFSTTQLPFLKGHRSFFRIPTHRSDIWLSTDFEITGGKHSMLAPVCWTQLTVQPVAQITLFTRLFSTPWPKLVRHVAC